MSSSPKGELAIVNNKKALIIVENNAIPYDNRVMYEAITLRDDGWEVAVICPFAPGSINLKSEASNQPRVIEGITNYQFKVPFADEGVLGYLIEYLTAFFQILRLSWRVWKDGRFDVIHFCNPPDIFFPIGIFYRLFGVGVVFDHHDLFPEFIMSRYKGFKGRLLEIAARVFEFFTLRSSQAVISTNESYRQIAIKRGKLSEEQVLVVRNGPKIDRFLSVEADPSLKQGFQYMTCYAGVMGHDDGVVELQQSIRYIVHELGRQDIFFVLLGNGAVYQKVLEQFNEWELDKFVYMPGMVHDRDLLKKYLATSDVCLSPEPYTPLNAYSTFVKIGEYMAVGKPVVAYDLIESRYTAQEAGVYVKPNDYEEYGRAILALLGDSKKREEMGKVGQKRILESLSWEKQEPHLLRAYQIATRK
jgi:glycosyltransferase involved in cell wall biosynthesis